MHAVRLRDRDHGLRRVGERLERLAQQPEGGVLACHERPAHQVAGRVAEHQQVSSVVGGSAEKALVVRVAAHHPVQDDDVGRFDGLRGGGDVDQTAGDPVAQSGSLGELRSVAVVDADELEVRRVLGPPAEQLELDVADAPADLEDGRAVDAAAGDEVDDADRSPVQTASAIPGPQVPGEPGPEHVVAPAGVAAAAHDRSIAGGSIMLKVAPPVAAPIRAVRRPRPGRVPASVPCST